MELPDVSLILRKPHIFTLPSYLFLLPSYIFLLPSYIFLLIQLPATDNLHTPTRSAKKAQHRLRQFLCQLPDFHSFLIRLQVVHLQHHEPVISNHPPFALPILIVSRKTDAWQADTTFPLRRHLSVSQSVRIHQVIHLTHFPHCLHHATVFDGCNQINQLHAVNHLFATVFLQ